MKRTIPLLTGLFLILAGILGGCTQAVESPGMLGADIQMGIQQLTLSASELATITGAANTLDLVVTRKPSFASLAGVTWSSSNATVATVDQAGHIVPQTDEKITEPASTVITVKANDDPSIYATCTVTVYPDYGSDRTWDFKTAPKDGETNWTSTTTVGTHTNADYGYGMTLQGQTGSATWTSIGSTPDGLVFPLLGDNAITHPSPWYYRNIDPEEPYAFGIAPTNGSRTMAWSGSAAPVGIFLTGNGALYCGTGRPISIAAIRGPFTVYAEYLSNGAASRGVIVRFGDKGTIVLGEPSTSTSDGKILTASYENEGILPYVYLETYDNTVRIYEVRIKAGIVPPSAFNDKWQFAVTGDDSLFAGETKTLGLNLALPASVGVAWSIEGDASIVGESSQPSVKVTSTAAGEDFTVTATLTYPGREPITVKQKIKVESYAPVESVTITPETPTVAMGKTVDLTAVITPTYASHPVYAWSITAGADNAEISAGADGEKATFTGKKDGLFTAKVTVTTTDPQTGVSVTKEASKEVTVTYTPIEAVSITGDDKVVLEGDSVSLSSSPTPAAADLFEPEYQWEIISGTGGEFDGATNGATAKVKASAGASAGNTFTVKVTVTTKNGAGTPTSKSNTKQMTVTSGGPVESIAWNFQQVPSGWVDDGSTNNGTDADYGNGMTLTASTRTTRIKTTQTADGASTGCIQPNGAGAFAKIEDVQGPFDITLKYTDTGSSAQGRTPYIQIPSGTTVGTGPGSNGATVISYTYRYTGTDKVTVILNGSGALRYFDVIIDFIGGSNVIWEWETGDSDVWPSGTGATNKTTVQDKTVMVRSGSVSLQEGGLFQNTARLIIGSGMDTDTSAEKSDPQGELDLSRPARLTFVFSGASNTTGHFQIYVNNNTTTQGNSVLGNNCRPGNPTVPDSGEKTITVTINGTADSGHFQDYVLTSSHESLSHAFVMVRCDSSLTVLIKSMKFEYLE